MPTPLILLLILLNLLSCVGCLFIGGLLILILRRYDLYHANFRLILSNIWLCLVANCLAQMLRPALLLFEAHRSFSFIVQASFKKKTNKHNSKKVQNLNLTKYPDNSHECMCFDPLPVVFCLLLAVFGLFLCIERLYASFNFCTAQLKL